MSAPLQPGTTAYDLRHDLFRWCVFSVICSVLCNFLPNAKHLDRHPKGKRVYQYLIDLMAFFAGNWRTAIPSLDLEFLGFRLRRAIPHFPSLDRRRRNRRRA